MYLGRRCSAPSALVAFWRWKLRVRGTSPNVDCEEKHEVDAEISEYRRSQHQSDEPRAILSVPLYNEQRQKNQSQLHQNECPDAVPQIVRHNGIALECRTRIQHQQRGHQIHSADDNQYHAFFCKCHLTCPTTILIVPCFSGNLTDEYCRIEWNASALFFSGLKNTELV